MVRWVLAIVVAGTACAKDSAPEPAPEPQRPPSIDSAEVTRAVDACKGYVDKLCACPSDNARKECKLAQMLPEAIEVARRLAINPKANGDDARQAASNIRTTVKRCIEESAKLASAGCP